MNKYPIGPNLKLKFNFKLEEDDDDFGYYLFAVDIPQIREIFEEAKIEMSI